MPAVDNLEISSSEILTPTESSNIQKKKKKRKPKKSAKAKEAALKSKAPEVPDPDGRPPVLCISRNKHWRYISSYHGPWLQLPLELLESLLVLNLDPATLTAPETRFLPPPITTAASKQRDRGYLTLGDYSPPESPRNTFSSLPPPPSFPTPKPGKATPPPIDPGVFRRSHPSAGSSTRLLSSPCLGSIRGGPNTNNSPWATAQSLGINLLGNPAGGGRNVAMSAMRVHRLRALAVQKLAQAYKTDEIASSVMVMQGGSVFDDVAERVLKNEPNDIDAKYVHFFHEKIPSRQLAESTTTKILDELIAAQPQRLEFYRTRGIVHCFRDEYPQATKDFTYALKEARAARKAKMAHRTNGQGDLRNGRGGKKRKANAHKHTNGQAPPDGTSVMGSENGGDAPDGGPPVLHPSVLPNAPEPIEPQLLFLRGAAYLQQAVFMIETSVLKLEGIRKLRLCYIENGKFGGVEMGNPEGPLGKADGPKLMAYREALGETRFREQITALLKKSLRDHERFLAHFDTLESANNTSGGDIAQRTEHAFLLSESMRPGNHASAPPPRMDAPSMFTTYHPLLVESHFSVLICYLMLADFMSILPTFVRTASLVDGLEGYPVFLPPRSMGQAEFIEILERLAAGWRNGVQPHSLSAPRGKGRLAIEAPRCTSPTPTLPDHYPGEGLSSNSWASVSSVPSYGPDHGTPPPSAVEALDCARMLLSPVANRQRERAEKAAADKVSVPGNKKKAVPINIPLHGPRVEIVLAWLGAVHLPELDGA
ncbi:hypothetical protein BD779DRAFT_1607832 [Infundibulicybe gibba]|nr:hypothetical protein BD779DRAFT_1607832 [Infundibulicybe gibba]